MMTSFKTWLASLKIGTKAFGTLIAIGIILLAALLLFHLLSRVEQLAEDKGGATVRGAVTEKGMSNVEKANRASIAADGDSRITYDSCLRYSDTPENC